MAISSIFHNVILRTSEEIESFIRAAEASEADPYAKPAGAPTYKVSTDTDELMRILELNEKNRQLTNDNKRT